MARLERKDLAKEFEDIVKQEIKNHNDSVLANNVSINEFRHQLELLKRTLEQQASHYHSLFNGVSLSNDSKHESAEKSMFSVKSNLNDFRELLTRKIEDVKSSMAIKESYFLTISDFDQFKLKCDEWMAQIKRLFDVSQSHAAQNTIQASKSHLPICEDLRKSIQQIRKEEEEWRKELSSSLDAYAINHEGIRREIEICKKRSFVIEKNIENLYTEIEKLKSHK